MQKQNRRGRCSGRNRTREKNLVAESEQEWKRYRLQESDRDRGRNRRGEGDLVAEKNMRGKDSGR